MTLDQLNRAKAVVMADATGVHWPLAYRAGVAEYCAIGGLAIAAGLRNEDIDLGVRIGPALPAPFPWAGSITVVYERIRTALWREYGITTADTRVIWTANDRVPVDQDTVEARRERVCAALDWIYENQHRAALTAAVSA